MSTTPYKHIELKDNTVSFMDGDQRLSFERATLPQAFLEWVKEGRRSMFDLLEGNGGKAGFFGSHLPVMVTCSRGNPVPFNTGNKGVGLVPVAGRINDYCAEYQRVFEDYAHRPWEESLAGRLECVRGFINSEDVADNALVTLEIFENNTFRNLCDYPVATLHYAGEGPVYMSYQINAVVEVAQPEHPAYNFAFLSRQLFEYDDFHITQTQFPYAYIFHPIEVKDKTPFPRRLGVGRETPREWNEMMLVWDDDVLEQLVRAPAMIQKMIIKFTEEYAREHGHNTVSLPIFNAVRTRYMKGGGQD